VGRNRETFVVFAENRLAWTAVSAAVDSVIAELAGTTVGAESGAASPRPAPGVVCLLGAGGSGKSFLLQQARDRILQQLPDAPIDLLSLDRFSGTLSRAAHAGKMASWRQYWAGRRLVMLDDFQTIPSKKETQQQLVALMDGWQASGARLIVASRSSLAERRDVSRRLVSRLHQGITAELLEPGEQGRRALVAALASAAAIGRGRGESAPAGSRNLLADDGAERLVKAGPRTARAFTAAVQAVAASKRPAPLDARAVDEILAARRFEGQVALPAVARSVAKAFQVSIAALKGASRTQAVVAPRQVAMFLARELTPSSLQEIGRFFGGRDHATVLHAVHRTRERIVGNPLVARQVQQLRIELLAEPG